MNLRLMLVIATSFFMLVSCGKTSSFWGSVDKPRNDEQYLNKARACFDEGDIECAKENYGKVTTGLETVNFESGFISLAEAGASLDVIAPAFGGKEKNIFKKVAEALKKQTADQYAIRAAKIDDAKTKFNAVSGDAGKYARALTDLVSLSSLLAQQMGENNLLETTDIVTTPTACAAETSSTLYATCTGPMSDADALTFKTKLSSANETIKQIDAGAGDLSSLITETEDTMTGVIKLACQATLAQSGTVCLLTPTDTCSSLAAFNTCVANTSSDLKGKVVRYLIISNILN